MPQYEPTSAAFVRAVYPRINDYLQLRDFPSLGKIAYAKVRNIEVSTYDYKAAANVTSSTASDYSANQIDNLIPYDGHLHLVIPTINPEDVLFSVAAPATGAASAITIADQDCNTRSLGIVLNGSNIVVQARESLRVKLKFPGTVPFWTLDKLTDAGYIDWTVSSPEAPNAAYMFGVSDASKTSTLQLRFEMPANNLSKTAGMQAYVRFYVGVVDYEPIFDLVPPVYTPVPFYPPAASVPSQISVGARYGRGLGLSDIPGLAR